jgi:hypothetical protein
MITLYHGTGAQDFLLQNEVAPPDEWLGIWAKTKKLLGLRNRELAAKYLDTMGFRLHQGTNVFNDDFYVLCAALPAEQFVRFEKQELTPADKLAFAQIAETVTEVSRYYIRFIAADMDIASLSGLADVPPPELGNTSKVVEQALMDAQVLLQTSGPASAFDRVHTALHGHLKKVCEDAGIELADNASVVDVFGVLRRQHPAFRQMGPHSEFVLAALRGIAKVIDSLDPTRNKASLAHPNELLDKPEAMLMINCTRTVLHYVDARLKTGRST